MAVRSLNKVMLIGNLTRDPELRYTANGTAVVSFGIATNREYSPANSSETVENTEFHNIVAWAKLAELCDKLLKKGEKVYVEGRLQTRDWEDEQSKKRMYRTEIVINEMLILSPKKEEYPQSDDVSSSMAEDRADAHNEDVSDEIVSDEIPF
jgi:single-strand DNA-binding protein